MRRTWVRVGATVFVLAGLVFLVLLLGDQWERLRDMRRSVEGYDWSLRPSWIAASLLLATVNLLEMSSVWVKLFRESGGSVSYREGWRIWSATNVGRYIPGKLWHLGGLTVYLRRRGQSGAAGLVSSVAFQVLILVTGAATAATVLVGRPHSPLGASPWTTGGVLILLAAALHPAVLRKSAGVASRLMKEGDVEIDRIGNRGLAASAGAIVLSWGVYGLSLWCMLRGTVGAGVMDPLELTAVFAASYVVGYLALLSPGGLLVREGAMVGLLASLGGLPVGVATVLAVGYRIISTVSELLFLAFSFLWPTLSPADAPGARGESPGTPRREIDEPGSAGDGGRPQGR